MLHKIRKTTNSLVFRIFIGILAIAFAWGFRSAIGNFGDKLLVSFNDIDSIYYSEFHKARAEEISKIQRTKGSGLTEQELDNMQIADSVLQNLISKRLIAYVAKSYDLDFSEATIANLIKSQPLFKNESGNFDIDRFRSYIRMTNLSPEEYSKEVKDSLSMSIIVRNLGGNTFIPRARINNVINHMSEARIADIVSIDLTSMELPIKDTEEKTLQNFYNENKNLFIKPWQREVCYSAITEKSSQNHIIIHDKEIQKFYKENKSDFNGKTLEQSKNNVIRHLYKEKFSHWIINLSKSLDDEVAGGSNLSEITSKYKLPRKCESNITASNIAKKASGLLADHITDIYDMEVGEVSYPADLKQGGIMLFEIAKYEPEAITEYSKIKNLVQKKYSEFTYRQNKIKAAQDFAGIVTHSNFTAKAEEKDLKITPNTIFVRMNGDKKYPANMISNLFSAKKNQILGPFIDGNKAHLMLLRNIKHDKATIDKLKNSKINLTNHMRANFADELLIFAGQKSDMQIKANPDSLKLSSENRE